MNLENDRRGEYTEQAAGFVWRLELPEAEGLYWSRNLATGERQLLRVFRERDKLWVGIRLKNWGHGVVCGFDQFKRASLGREAFCGPDTAPPEE